MEEEQPYKCDYNKIKYELNNISTSYKSKIYTLLFSLSILFFILFAISNTHSGGGVS